MRLSAPRDERIDPLGPLSVVAVWGRLVRAGDDVAIRTDREKKRHLGIALPVRHEIVANRRSIGREQRLELWERGHEPRGQRQRRESVPLNALHELFGPRQIGVDGRRHRAIRHHAHEDPGCCGKQDEQPARNREDLLRMRCARRGPPRRYCRRATRCRRAGGLEEEREIASRSRPIACLFLQAPLEDSGNPGRQPGHGAAQRRWIVAQDRRQRFGRRVAPKRVRAGQHFVDDDPKREEV